MCKDGHIVGNHTWHHPDMSQMSTLESFQKELTDVEKIYKENKEKPEFVKLCNKKKEEFADKASIIIDKALKRLEEALDDKEDKIPVNNLSTVIGTLYDKRALAKGDSTSNTELSIKMDEKVEELSK